MINYFFHFQIFELVFNKYKRKVNRAVTLFDSDQIEETLFEFRTTNKRLVEFVETAATTF